MCVCRDILPLRPLVLLLRPWWPWHYYYFFCYYVWRHYLWPCHQRIIWNSNGRVWNWIWKHQLLPDWQLYGWNSGASFNVGKVLRPDSVNSSCACVHSCWPKPIFNCRYWHSEHLLVYSGYSYCHQDLHVCAPCRHSLYRNQWNSSSPGLHGQHSHPRLSLVPGDCGRWMSSSQWVLYSRLQLPLHGYNNSCHHQCLYLLES